MNNALIISESKRTPIQIAHHAHSIIYDYEKGEKLCSQCGIIIQDKVFDVELDANFYKIKSNTNTVLPHSLILNDKDMSTTISDYDATSARRITNRKELNKIHFYSKVVSCSNDKRNLKIAIDLLNRIRDKL